MKEYRVSNFVYKCKCGFIMNVSVDFGVPQEVIKCRFCDNSIKRIQA